MNSSPVSRDETRILSPEATDALRDAFRLHLATPSQPANVQISDALARVCAEARQERIPAERLLIAFKGVWNSLPEVRELPGHRAADEVRELVSLCIERYYSSE